MASNILISEAWLRGFCGACDARRGEAHMEDCPDDKRCSCDGGWVVVGSNYCRACTAERQEDQAYEAGKNLWKEGRNGRRG